MHPTIYDQAAAYLFHICKNHPFIDSNKRTAAASSLIFLADDEVELKFDMEDFELIVLNTERGATSKKEISLLRWYRSLGPKTSKVKLITIG